MSMEFAAWNSLYHMMTAQQDERPFTWATVKRIAGFARSHAAQLVGFLVLSVVGAFLAVATPLLAGRVVDLIFTSAPYARRAADRPRHRGHRDRWRPGLGLVQRWLSARIGEGLILDLRRAVFDHVLTMPIAFFTRTRTGALVSRLNNDVIGAQRAFSETLSGVVSNIVALVLALIVMLALSWQITLLALVLLPVFVIPARRMGRRLARLRAGGGQPQRDHGQPDDRALLRAGRDAGQAVRPAGAGVGRVRRCGRPGCATSASAARWCRRSS